jgi:hypothetical protein
VLGFPVADERNGFDEDAYLFEQSRSLFDSVVIELGWVKEDALTDFVTPAHTGEALSRLLIGRVGAVGQLGDDRGFTVRRVASEMWWHLRFLFFLPEPGHSLSGSQSSSAGAANEKEGGLYGLLSVWLWSEMIYGEKFVFSTYRSKLLFTTLFPHFSIYSGVSVSAKSRYVTFCNHSGDSVFLLPPCFASTTTG